MVPRWWSLRRWSSIPSVRCERSAIDEDPLAGEAPGRWLPRKVDGDAQADPRAGRLEAREGAAEGRAERGCLEHALRPDDDVGQVEAVVREGREELGVEGPRPVVVRPAQVGPGDLVGTLGREGRHKPINVAPVLGDRVLLPEAPDLPELRRVRL